MVGRNNGQIPHLSLMASLLWLTVNFIFPHSPLMRNNTIPSFYPSFIESILIKWFQWQFSHHSFSILLLDEYTEEIMLTKATNHFKLPVTSNRATTTSRYIKVTSRPITFPQKTNSQPFPQKTNSQTFPQKTHSHMKHVSFPSTTKSQLILKCLFGVFKFNLQN